MEAIFTPNEAAAFAHLSPKRVYLSSARGLPLNLIGLVGDESWSQYCVKL